MDLYEVLQVHPGADAEVIRAAYRALARVHHPDAGGSAARMAEINDAWAVLGDARLRRKYDREHGVGHHPRNLSGRPVHGPAPGWAPPGFSTHAASARTTPPEAAGAARPGATSDAFGRADGSRSVGEEPSAARPAAAPADTTSRDGSRILDFGRYAGWSILDLSRSDPDYLLWLERTPIGRSFRSEIARALEFRRGPAPAMATAGAGVATPSGPTTGRRFGRWFR